MASKRLDAHSGRSLCRLTLRGKRETTRREDVPPALPELLDAEQRAALALPDGAKYKRMIMDLEGVTVEQPTKPLKPRQRQVRRIVGLLRYTNKVHPEFTHELHVLSSCMHNPSPEAVVLALLAAPTPGPSVAAPSFLPPPRSLPRAPPEAARCP